MKTGCSHDQVEAVTGKCERRVGLIHRELTRSMPTIPVNQALVDVCPDKREAVDRLVDGRQLAGSASEVEE